MTRIFPNLRGTGTHRADDRIAELTTHYEQKLAELREENVALLNWRAGADDHFMNLDQHRNELEAEVEQLKAVLAGEREARAGIEKDRDAQERWIQHLQEQLAQRTRRLDVGVKAEHVIAETQELSVEEIRRHCTPVPLHQAPFATTNPGRVRPSWATNDPAA